jgi:ribosomal-protein-serine acetyltransferase
MNSADRGRIPERIEGSDGLVIRLWEPGDAASLSRAAAESYEHLRPWMEWAAAEPMPQRQRCQQIIGWRRDWEENRDAVYGVFVDGEIAGGCGLHRRLAEDGLEIGYWIHARFVRRGLATRAVALLTEAALALPGITHVEIHHDKANEASGAIPRKLGFEFLGEHADKPAAAGDVGIECRWRIDERRWAIASARR